MPITFGSSVPTYILSGERVLNPRFAINYTANPSFHSRLDGGVRGDNLSDDTVALQTAINAAASVGQKFWLAPGIYLISATIIVPAGLILEGVDGFSVIKAANPSMTANLMQIGNGSLTGNYLNGYCEGLTFVGPDGAPAKNGQVALLLNAVTQFDIRHCTFLNTDIGSRMINNCYGSGYTRCRWGVGNSCNCGVDLPGPNDGVGAGAGNQNYVRDCWGTGKTASVNWGGSYDGCVVSGGQHVSGPGAGDGRAGAFRLGIDYVTGNVGNNVGTIEISMVDCEGPAGWFIYSETQVGFLKLSTCDVLANHSDVSSLGLLKIINARSSIVALEGIELDGPFASAAPIVMQGDYGSSYVTSSGQTVPSNLSFNGVAAQNTQPFDALTLSPGTPGHARGRSYSGPSASWTYMDGLFTRVNNGNLQTAVRPAVGASWVWKTINAA